MAKNILELIEDYMGMGMSEEAAGELALKDLGNFPYEDEEDHTCCR